MKATSTIGKKEYPNGTYEGEFDKKGKRSGHGRFLYKDGSSFEGFYEDDLESGIGVTTHPDGKRLIASYVKGKINGFAQLIHPDGKMERPAFFIDGEVRKTYEELPLVEDPFEETRMNGGTYLAQKRNGVLSGYFIGSSSLLTRHEGFQAKGRPCGAVRKAKAYGTEIDAIDFAEKEYAKIRGQDGKTTIGRALLDVPIYEGGVIDEKGDCHIGYFKGGEFKEFGMAGK